MNKQLEQEMTINMTRCTVIAQMKAEVLADIASGTVPTNVASFGDLHDYVDANCYGGFCDDKAFDALEAELGDEKFYALINECQNAVDEWLANGRPTN